MPTSTIARTRICRKCGRELPIGCFAAYDAERKWYDGECRDCRGADGRVRGRSAVLLGARIWREHRDEGMSVREAADMAGCNRETLRRHLRKTGVAGGPLRATYPEPFRRECADAYLAGGGTYEEVAAMLGVKPKTLRAWVQRYRQEPCRDCRSREWRARHPRGAS